MGRPYLAALFGLQIRPVALVDGNGDPGASIVDTAGLALDSTLQAVGDALTPVLRSQYFASTLGAPVKTSAGRVFSVIATNGNAAIRYLQFFNKTTAPAANDVPILSIPIGAGTANTPGVSSPDDAHFGGGLVFSSGISVGISTAYGTYVAGATVGDHTVNVAYV